MCDSFCEATQGELVFFAGFRFVEIEVLEALKFTYFSV